MNFSKRLSNSMEQKSGKRLLRFSKIELMYNASIDGKKYLTLLSSKVLGPKKRTKS